MPRPSGRGASRLRLRTRVAGSSLRVLVASHGKCGSRSLVVMPGNGQCDEWTGCAPVAVVYLRVCNGGLTTSAFRCAPLLRKETACRGPSGLRFGADPGDCVADLSAPQRYDSGWQHPAERKAQRLRAIAVSVGGYWLAASAACRWRRRIRPHLRELRFAWVTAGRFGDALSLGLWPSGLGPWGKATPSQISSSERIFVLPSGKNRLCTASALHARPLLR